MLNYDTLWYFNYVCILIHNFNKTSIFFSFHLGYILSFSKDRIRCSHLVPFFLWLFLPSLWILGGALCSLFMLQILFIFSFAICSLLSSGAAPQFYHVPESHVESSPRMRSRSRLTPTFRWICKTYVAWNSNPLKQSQHWIWSLESYSVNRPLV